MYLIIQLSTMPCRRMEWNYSSNILNLSTRWKWVVSFMRLMLTPEISPWYQLNRRLKFLWGAHNWDISIQDLGKEFFIQFNSISWAAPEMVYSLNGFLIFFINIHCLHTISLCCPRSVSFPNIVFMPSSMRTLTSSTCEYKTYLSRVLMF
jgi:hypothetical protein